MKLLLLLLLPIAMASNMQIDIDIDAVGLVTENITIYTDENFQSISYNPGQLPLTVIYNGEYSVDGTTLIFPYEQPLNFQLVFENLADKNFGGNSFRTFFQPGVDNYIVKVALPLHAILDDEPAAIPEPDSIITDGRQIKLTWTFDSDAGISVFYKETTNRFIPIIIIFSIIILCSVIASRYFLKKKINNILSEDESAVLGLVKKLNRQDYIAKELNFSKSKMSKVVRKLEEKGLVKKKPYFKTNKLKL